MFLVPQSRIKIGDVTFTSLNEVVIDRSVKDFESRATITLPRNFAKRGNKGVTEFIKKGNAVTIVLGYNNSIYVEFTGYVDTIGASTPLVIECDGEWYPHKKNELTPKTIEKATLKQVLTYAFPDYTIDCPDTNLGTFAVGKVSSFAVLKAVKDSAGFYTRIDETKKIISCYYAYEPTVTTNHNYVFGTRSDELLKSLRLRKLFPNIKKNDLKFERKDDLKIQITAKAKQRDGKTLQVIVGSTHDLADKRTRNYGYEITNEVELKAAAEKDLKLMNFDGYKGSVTGFGYPRVNAGDSVTIIDPENTEREGKYLCEKVKINYSVTIGYERVTTISYKI